MFNLIVIVTKPAYEPKTVLVPFHWDGHKSCYFFLQKVFVLAGVIIKFTEAWVIMLDL